MKPEPVNRSSLPAYPTRDELRADRSFLARYLPAGWNFGRGLAGAAAIFVAAGLPGCGGGPCMPASPEEVELAQIEQADTEAEWEEVQDEEEPIISIVSGWIESLLEDPQQQFFFGCVAVTAPAYMPEDEAAQVVRDSGVNG